MAVKGRRIRIGFLMAYSGTNLGDGAIQSAILENLSKRLPAAEFYGINLYPKETERRHGIPGFPITGLAVESYSSHETLFGEDNSPSRKQQPSAWLRVVNRVREGVKEIPPLASGSRFILRRLCEARNIILEIRHLIRSYSFVRKLDLLIVSGSGQLIELFGGPWGHPYSVFRWALLAKLTKTRLAVASVGITGSLKTSLSRYFLRTALATSCYRSYRDQGTKQLLKAWRFTHEDPCVPDLAISLDLSRYNRGNAPFDVPEAHTPVVAVGPVTYLKPKYWPEHDLVAYNRYLGDFTDFTYWLIQRGYRILLFASTGLDRLALADLKDRIKQRYGHYALTHLAEPSITSLEDLLRHLSTAQFVVATRFHGVLLSHILLKPALAISYDPKVAAHMKDLNQLPYNFDIRSVNARHLREAFALLEASAPHVRADISTRLDAFRVLLEIQYERLVRYATTPPEYLPQQATRR